MQKLQILFPDPLMSRLRTIAKEEDRPVSEIIRRSVERFLEMKPEKRGGKAKLPTFQGGRVLVAATDLKQVIYGDGDL